MRQGAALPRPELPVPVLLSFLLGSLGSASHAGLTNIHILTRSCRYLPAGSGAANISSGISVYAFAFAPRVSARTFIADRDAQKVRKSK